MQSFDNYTCGSIVSHIELKILLGAAVEINFMTMLHTNKAVWSTCDLRVSVTYSDLLFKYKESYIYFDV